MNKNNWNWKFVVAEALIIAGSVYFAIVLEGISDERDKAAEATHALYQLREELRQDQKDLAEILAEQRELEATYQRVIDWLATPDAIPVAEFDRDITRLKHTNRTMFPRQATWTTMLAEGQLIALHNQPLVTSLGNLYENVNTRLVYNGVEYDNAKIATSRGILTELWDSLNQEFFNDDPEFIRQTRAKLHYQRGHTQWYLQLLGQWGERLDSAINQVSEHLGGQVPD